MAILCTQAPLDVGGANAFAITLGVRRPSELVAAFVDRIARVRRAVSVAFVQMLVLFEEIFAALGRALFVEGRELGAEALSDFLAAQGAGLVKCVPTLVAAGSTALVRRAGVSAHALSGAGGVMTHPASFAAFAVSPGSSLGLLRPRPSDLQEQNEGSEAHHLESQNSSNVHEHTSSRRGSRRRPLAALPCQPGGSMCSTPLVRNGCALVCGAVEVWLSDVVNSGLGGIAPQRPLKLGVRFSPKASIASRMSSV